MTYYGIRDTNVYAIVLALYQLVHGAGGTVIGPAPAPGQIAVMIVEESSDRNHLTADQRAALLSTAPGSVRDYLKGHASKDAAGNPQFRLVDKDDAMDKDAKLWQDAFAAKGPTVPWLVVMGPRSPPPVFSGELPKTKADIFGTLKRYGGP